MPALLTESGRYIKRYKGAYASRCFTCHNNIETGDDYAGLWQRFKEQMLVIRINSHQFWVCRTCHRDFEAGRLFSASLNAYKYETKARKTRSSSFV